MTFSFSLYRSLKQRDYKPVANKNDAVETDQDLAFGPHSVVTTLSEHQQDLAWQAALDAMSDASRGREKSRSAS